MAPLVGAVVWLVLFIAFIALVWSNPRARTASAPPRVPEAVVVGTGVAAFVAGAVSLVLLLRQLIPG